MRKVVSSSSFALPAPRPIHKISCMQWKCKVMILYLWWNQFQPFSIIIKQQQQQQQSFVRQASFPLILGQLTPSCTTTYLHHTSRYVHLHRVQHHPDQSSWLACMLSPSLRQLLFRNEFSNPKWVHNIISHLGMGECIPLHISSHSAHTHKEGARMA